MTDDGASDRDTVSTLAALGALAYIAETLLHEAVGHGGVCVLLGGRIILVQSLSMQCSQDSLLMVLSGPYANAIAAIGAAVLVRFLPPRLVALRYFVWLLFVFNALVGGGYLAVGGATGFGDWGVIFSGYTPDIVWRPFAVVTGAIIYLGALRIAAGQLARIVGPTGLAPGRLGGLAIMPGLGAGTVALGAVLYGQAGDPLRLGLAAGSSLFVGWSLMAMDRFRLPMTSAAPDRPVTRSYVAIALALMIGLAFIVVIGPGWRPGA